MNIDRAIPDLIQYLDRIEFNRSTLEKLLGVKFTQVASFKATYESSKLKATLALIIYRSSRVNQWYISIGPNKIYIPIDKMTWRESRDYAKELIKSNNNLILKDL